MSEEATKHAKAGQACSPHPSSLWAPAPQHEVLENHGTAQRLGVRWYLSPPALSARSLLSGSALSVLAHAGMGLMVAAEN